MEYPKKLYKYVPPERTDILKNQLIRFTQPSALNDPFELQPLYDQLLSESELKEAMNPPFEFIEEALRKLYINLPSEQQARISVEQLIAHAQANPELIKKSLEEGEPLLRNELSIFATQTKKMLLDALQTIGILSLSETIENPLLWAHYASSHKGFAIEFNTEHKFFHRRRSDKDELFHLRKVKYASRSSLGRTLSDLNGDDVLITKEELWAYEAEWRMLVPLQGAERVLSIDSDEIYLYTIPFSAISGIIIGARAPTSLYEELKTQLQSMNSPHITLKRAVLDPANQSIKVD